MGSAVGRVVLKLARVYIPPHSREVAGRMVRVPGYWRQEHGATGLMRSIKSPGPKRGTLATNQTAVKGQLRTPKMKGRPKAITPMKVPAHARTAPRAQRSEHKEMVVALKKTLIDSHGFKRVAQGQAQHSKAGVSIRERKGIRGPTAWAVTTSEGTKEFTDMREAYDHAVGAVRRHKEKDNGESTE